MAKVDNLILNKKKSHSSKSKYSGVNFHAAVEHGDLSAVETILKTGIDIETPNQNGSTALMTAVERRYKPIIKLLLEYGADIAASCIGSLCNNKSGLRRTILHYAVEIIPDDSIIHMLLSVKPNFEPASTEVFNKVVDYARRRRNTKIFKYLFRYTDVRMLHSSIQKLISVRETSAINILDRSFYSALLWAIKKKRIQVVKWLLENGASLYRVSLYHHTDNRQYLSCTILHMAALWYCGNQDEEIVRILIHHSEDINATILCNSTALHIAVRHGKLKLVKLLVRLGADVNRANWDQQLCNVCSPLRLALYHPNLRIFKYLLSTKKISPENLTLVASLLTDHGIQGDFEHKSKALLQSCLTDYRSPENESLRLHLAIMLKDQKVIDSFFNRYYDINLWKWNGMYPIHRAAKSSNIDFIIRLIDLDVDLNMKDEKLGFTALYYAAKNLDTLIVSFLLNNGADIHVLNNYVRCELLEFLNQFPESNIIQLLVDTTPVIFYHSYTLHFDRFFGNIIKQHIIKSKIANLLLDPHFSHWQEFYSQSTIDKFSSECIAEIDLLKQEKICNTSFLSYHHFLTDDVCRLAYYTRNSVLKKNFKRFQLSIKFPIYGQMIINYFHRARHRLKLILNFETVLADILCHFPTNFVCSISDYLSEEELSMF